MVVPSTKSNKKLRKILLFGVLPFMVAALNGAVEREADAAINSTYYESTDSCAGTPYDCIKITIAAVRGTKLATCAYLAAHSEEELAETAAQWVAADAPCS